MVPTLRRMDTPASGPRPPATRLVPPPRRRELRHLTGIRIVAALWVVAFHFEAQYTLLLPEVGGLVWLTGSRGFLAVDLFFVLSGYILAYQHHDAFARGRGDYRGFLAKRLARIYPLQIATLAFLVVLVVATPLGTKIGSQQAYTAWGAVQDVLLIRGWTGPSQGWNYPAWSLSAEWLAYLLFPVVVLLLAVVARSSRAALVAVIAGAVVLEAVGSAVLPWADHMPIAPVRVIVAFTAGVALFRLCRDAPQRTRNGWLGGLLLAALILVTPVLAEGPLVAAVSLASCVAIVGLLAAGSGPVVALLGSGPVEYGGRISFSLYMIHGIALLLSPVRFLGIETAAALPLIARVGLAVGQVAVLLGLSVAAYHFVERPGQRLILGWTTRRPRRSREVESPSADGHGHDDARGERPQREDEDEAVHDPRNGG
jgi:peptidoglycan/LPS O-acetylase OafA/YrhL